MLAVAPLPKNNQKKEVSFMKVVDNRAIREAEAEENQKKSWLQKMQDRNDARRKNEEMKKQNTLEFRQEWRVHGELDPIIPSTWMEIDREYGKDKFIETAIREHDQVDEIIVEPFGEPRLNQRVVKIEFTPEEMAAFQKNARKAGLAPDQFALALVYTKAKKLNDEQKSEREAYWKEQEKNKLHYVNGVEISANLYEKLKAEYKEEVPPELKYSAFFMDRANEWIAKALNDYYLEKR